MRTLSLQRGDAFILVYDVTKAETFEEIRHTRDEIHGVRHTNNVPIVVVGNKTDLVDVEPREVSSLNDITGYFGSAGCVRAYHTLCRGDVGARSPFARARNSGRPM